MLEYLIFFGLLIAGFVPFILFQLHTPEYVPASPRNMCESPIERRLYDELIYNGYDVTPQVRCGAYRIDLALIAHRIAIECDGKAYHSSPEQKAHDRKKDRYLRKNGWTVMRFSGRQINGQMPKILAKIQKNTTK
ncbi:hypothetical protein SAFG77S_08033 [Streptomyces afghaniensis]